MEDISFTCHVYTVGKIGRLRSIFEGYFSYKTIIDEERKPPYLEMRVGVGDVVCVNFIFLFCFREDDDDDDDDDARATRQRASASNCSFQASVRA